MAEYIEREALIKQFCERCNEEMSESPCEPSECFAREVIIGVPAVGVAPVRHGRWEMRGGKRYCTSCGERACVTRDSEDFWYTIGTPYCPNCGAQMDLKENENDG